MIADLKKRDHFAIFSFAAVNIWSYAITLVSWSPLLDYLSYRLRFQPIDVKKMAPGFVEIEVD